MRNLGEEIKYVTIVEKILRSLTPKFDSKVSAIEEMQDLKNLTLAQLHGILIAFGMREGGSLDMREASFKTTTKGKEKEESGNELMDHWRQHGKQPDKNIDVRRLEKDQSTNIYHNNRKEEEHIRCGLSLFSFKEEYEWYIDSRFSHHMTGDKSKMESLKKNQYGKVIFGTNVPTKVTRKGKAKINRYIGANGSLLVQGLKKNILSVGQMEEETGKVISRGYRNLYKFYVLEEWNSRRYEEDSNSE
eukprot:PITA_25650